MDDQRICIQCLAAYNDGILHFAWIDASSDAAEMQAEVDKLLRTSPRPNVVRHTYRDTGGEEFTVDHHGPLSGKGLPRNPRTGKLAKHLVETFTTAEEFEIADFDGKVLRGCVTLDCVADAMQKLEDAYDILGSDADEIMEAYTDCFGEPDDAQQVADAYCGDYSRASDPMLEYAYEYVDSCGLLGDAPDFVSNYFDYEAFARDLKMDMAESNGHIFHSH